MGNSGIYEAEIKQQLNTMAGLCVPESSSNMFKGVKFRRLPEEWSGRSQAERDAYVEQVYIQDIPFDRDRQMLRDANLKLAREDNQLAFENSSRVLGGMQVLAVPLYSPQQLSEFIDEISKTTSGLQREYEGINRAG